MNRRFTFRLLSPAVVAMLLLAGCSPEDPPAAAVAEAAPEAPAAAPVAEPEPEPAPVQAGAADPALPEVIVLNGLPEVIAFLQAEDWWSPDEHSGQRAVPHLMITGIHPSWQTASAQLEVRDKKELFYRLMLPLVMHANAMIEDFRAGLLGAREELAADGRVSPQSLALIKRVAPLLRDMDAAAVDSLHAETPELDGMLEQLLYRLDVVPAGLALGQAAYESGYGTSRFAVQANSLFGQWTYGGDGIVPEQQRKSSKGDHRIKAFDWPFDSVRGYFINLMSHPAYEDFRRLRAELRAAGKPLDSLVLADGLLSYSERGQEYVDSLKDMIRKNGLDVADHAVFRDEPMRFLISEAGLQEAGRTREDIERMRESGELAEIIARMRLE